MDKNEFKKIEIHLKHNVNEYKAYLMANMSEVKKFIDIQKEKNSVDFNSHYNEEEHLFDLGMYLILDLALEFSDRPDTVCKNKKQKTIEYTEPSKFSNKLKFSFRNFLFTLFNTLLSIKILLKRGLSHQATILTRYYIETTELIIALMFDNELYEIYMQDYGDENEFKKWKRYFTPEKIRKVITKYENTVDINFNLYDFRKRQYNNLSQTVHNNFVDLNLGCLGTDFKNNDCFKYNIAGAITKDIEQTIAPAIYSTGIFLLYITEILCDVRNIKFCESNKDGDIPYLVALELYKNIYFTYAHKNATN